MAEDRDKVALVGVELTAKRDGSWVPTKKPSIAP